MAPKKKAAARKQSALAVEQHTLLKKPLDHLGKQLDIPGSFWQGRMTEEERAKIYKCTILDFSLLHRSSPEAVPTQAFRMQEMGADGKGSLETSDLESTKFWIEYPMPFLKYYYATFPSEDPKHVNDNVRGGDGDDDDGDGDDGDGADSEQVLKPAVLPAFPHVRLGQAPIYGYYTINSDTLVLMGPKSGMFRTEFECNIMGADGCKCTTKRTITHERDRACQTSNLVTHLREKAATCEFHKAALKIVDAGSKNVVEVDGESVLVFNFAEAFPYACTSIEHY